ncbi:MAG: glycosyltransferase family 4 protein [Nanoarchaeota archaeon]
MKVLMFGWEFPPFVAGGLGVACQDLVKGLCRNGVQITFVMPHAPQGASSPYAKIMGADAQKILIQRVETLLTPYMSEQQYLLVYQTWKSRNPLHTVYGQNLFDEIARYTEAASQIASSEDHDVIHVHDWMAFKAGINAKKKSKKPLVVHVHATEYDRTGGKPNEYIRRVEEEGLDSADHIVTISNYMKKQIMLHYGVNAAKISVVHWGIDHEVYQSKSRFCSPLSKNERIVLFLGRMTVQKGPDYFVEAACHVLRFVPNARFVMVGDGDMMGQVINRVAQLGLASRFSFTGFLRGEDVAKAYQMADVYVMPSVSEPFGLVGLEALKNNTPIIISKTSGVSEVVDHALRVDFWDVRGIADRIVGVLRYKALQSELRRNGAVQVQGLGIDAPAKKIIGVYKRIGVGG